MLKNHHSITCPVQCNGVFLSIHGDALTILQTKMFLAKEN